MYVRCTSAALIVCSCRCLLYRNAIIITISWQLNARVRRILFLVSGGCKARESGVLMTAWFLVCVVPYSNVPLVYKANPSARFS